MGDESAPGWIAPRELQQAQPLPPTPLYRLMRGDLVTIAAPGDLGKPRPALAIQADPFSAHANVSVLLVSSTLVDAPMLRVTAHPTASNGLLEPSQVMVYKATSVRRDRLGPVFGRVDSYRLVEIDRCLAVFLGIAK